MFKAVNLSDLMLKRGKSINPLSNPDTEFELYSIPAYENKVPEFLRGDEIGSNKQILVENDVLLSRIVPHIRRAWIVKPQSNRTLIGSGEWVVFRSEKADPGYLRNFLLSDVFHQQMMTTVRGVGGSLLRASPELIGKIEIPLPPLPIQKKIAAVMEKADELRRKREEQIKRLDDLLQATFLDMFGDPVTNPKGWPKCSLESLCHKVTDGTHQPPKFVPEGIPFLFVSNIVNGFIDFETEKFISERTFEELTSRTPIEVGDILYSTVGSYGKAVLVDTTKKFSFQRHIAHIKPNTQRIQAEFLLTQLNSNGVKRQADSQARGIAQKTLNLRELKGFEIFLPPHGQQIEFIKRKRKIDEVALTVKGSCSNNQALFNSLMQRAFKGELDLK